MVRREDFFGTSYVPPEGSSDDNDGGGQQRDPNSLAERIRANEDVTNFVPVEGAGTCDIYIYKI